MILPIYTYGQPVLRKTAEDITMDYPELQQLIQDMFETMDRPTNWQSHPLGGNFPRCHER